MFDFEIEDGKVNSNFSVDRIDNIFPHTVSNVNYVALTATEQNIERDIVVITQ